MSRTALATLQFHRIAARELILRFGLLKPRVDLALRAFRHLIRSFKPTVLFHAHVRDDKGLLLIQGIDNIVVACWSVNSHIALFNFFFASLTLIVIMVVEDIIILHSCLEHGLSRLVDGRACFIRL